MTKQKDHKSLKTSKRPPGARAEKEKKGKKTQSFPKKQKLLSNESGPSVLSPQEIEEIFLRFQESNPHPETELVYNTPYTLLVAVVLSAQATDVSVNKATAALFSAVNTPEAMVQLGEEKLRDFIKTISFFPTKARNIIALSQILCERYNGQIPASREELESLPGVGRKTANVVLNVIFKKPTLAVDTHIFRVSNRIPLQKGSTPLEVEQGLERLIPAVFKPHAHHWLVLHGRYVCKARKPLCPTCQIETLCRYPDKTRS